MTWQQGDQVRVESRSAMGKPVSGRALCPDWRFIKKSEHVFSLPSLPSCPFQLPRRSPEMQPSLSLHLPRSCLQAFPASTLQARGGDGAGGRPCHLDRAQTPCSDVTSRGGPEVSAYQQPDSSGGWKYDSPRRYMQRQAGPTRGCQIKKKRGRRTVSIDSLRGFELGRKSGHDFTENRHPGLSQLSGSGL